MQNSLKWRWRDFYFVGAYTFLHSRRTEPGLGTFPSEFDQTHNLNIIGSYKRGSWSFGTRLRFVTGRPFTPSMGGIFDSDNDAYRPNNGGFNSARYRNFFQWDLRADKKWVFNNWILSAYLDIQNVTNTGNVEAVQYDYDFDQFQEVTGLPLIPIFGLKGEF